MKGLKDICLLILVNYSKDIPNLNIFLFLSLCFKFVLCCAVLLSLFLHRGEDPVFAKFGSGALYLE